MLKLICIQKIILTIFHKFHLSLPFWLHWNHREHTHFLKTVADLFHIPVVTVYLNIRGKKIWKKKQNLYWKFMINSFWTILKPNLIPNKFTNLKITLYTEIIPPLTKDSKYKKFNLFHSLRLCLPYSKILFTEALLIN